MLWDLIYGHPLHRVWEQSHRADHTARRADTRVDVTQIDVRELQRSFDALSLACAAMWELLQERTGATDEDLLKKIEELDFQDGKRDGKLEAELKNCPRCTRPNKPSRDQCVYCGEDLPGLDPFQ